LAGCWFALMKPNSQSTVTFHLQKSKPTPRTETALAELVGKAVLSVEPLNEFGGLVYRPLVNCHDAFLWFMKNAEKRPELNFQLMVPISETGSQTNG
jgi:hypothetical protein